MKSIYTLTLSPAIDKSSVVDQVMAEHKLRCSDPRHEPGGGGINVSRAIKKLGGESIAVYPKGGPTGQLLHQMLDKENINQHCFETNNWTRENFIVVENMSNRQFRFTMPAPALTLDELNQCLEDLADASHQMDYLVVSGSTPPGIPVGYYGKIAKIAREKKAKLVLDTSGPALREVLDEGIYLLKPNLKELTELVGEELNDISAQEDAALKLVEKHHIEILVVSLGPAGALLASKDGVLHFSAPSVKMKSTVGAGDCMVAGITLSLSRGMGYAESLKYGIACGTAATMNPGTELCKLSDVENLYRWLQAR